MKRLALALVATGCASGNLERRVDDLELRPVHDPAIDARIDKLERRIADGEKAQRRQADEIVQLQKVVHELADQLADVQADLPMPGHGAAPPTPPPAPTMRGQLDPTKVYAVPLDDSPTLAGGPTAPVTLVAAVQFPEPFTHKSWSVLQQLVTDYAGDLRIVVKPFIVHPQAADATIAACAVGLQRKLDKYEDLVWTAYAASRHWPDATESRDLAKQAGVDLKAFDRDLGKCTTGKDRDVKMFARLGQGAVPTFWINGRPLSGAQPIGSFKQMIDDERTKANADRARGGDPKTYYTREVIKAGATTGP